MSLKDDIVKLYSGKSFSNDIEDSIERVVYKVVNLYVRSGDTNRLAIDYSVTFEKGELVIKLNNEYTKKIFNMEMR